MWRFSDNFFRNLRPASHEKGALSAHYSNRSRTECPSSVRASPCQLHFLWYSCHRQLYLIPFAARRTARRGSFFSYYCRLVMLSLDFHFFFHILFKTCEKESLYHQSIAFLCACFTRQSKKLHRTFTVCGVFPVYSSPQAISTPSSAFENRLFSRISRNFSTGYSNIVETFLQQGRGCGKQERGRAPGFSWVSAPFGLIFCFFHRLQPVFHMIYPQLWKQLWINLRICSLQVSVCYLLCR